VGVDRYILIAKAEGTAFANGLLRRVFHVLVSLLGVLKRLPGALVAGLMVLLFVGFGPNKMGVRCAVVQLHDPLMMLVA